MWPKMNYLHLYFTSYHFYQTVVFRDAATPSPFVTHSVENGEVKDEKCECLVDSVGHAENGAIIRNSSCTNNGGTDEYIYLDCLAYGTGCCSLQVIVIVTLYNLLGENYNIHVHLFL